MKICEVEIIIYQFVSRIKSTIRVYFQRWSKTEGPFVCKERCGVPKFFTKGFAAPHLHMLHPVHEHQKKSWPSCGVINTSQTRYFLCLPNALHNMSLGTVDRYELRVFFFLLNINSAGIRMTCLIGIHMSVKSTDFSDDYVAHRTIYSSA